MNGTGWGLGDSIGGDAGGSGVSATLRCMSPTCSDPMQKIDDAVESPVPGGALPWMLLSAAAAGVDGADEGGGRSILSNSVRFFELREKKKNLGRLGHDETGRGAC